MRSFNRDISTMDTRSDTNRLETPFMAGFRSGMSSCTVIGRKLSSLYKVPSDHPRGMDTLIEAIDHTVTRSR